MKIGILTGGGDCPGLNAVIRAAVRKGTFHHEVFCLFVGDAEQDPALHWPEEGRPARRSPWLLEPALRNLVIRHQPPINTENT